MKKRFGELNNGDDFEFAGKTLTKLDGFNAVTKVSRGKQNFLFFKHNLVTVEDPASSPETPFEDKATNDTNDDESLINESSETISAEQPTSYLNFNMTPLEGGAYSLNMQTDSLFKSLLRTDDRGMGEWKATLPPINVNGVVVDGLSIGQNDGNAWLSKDGTIISQIPMMPKNWIGGDTLIVVFNN